MVKITSCDQSSTMEEYNLESWANIGYTRSETRCPAHPLLTPWKFLRSSAVDLWQGCRDFESHSDYGYVNTKPQKQGVTSPLLRAQHLKMRITGIFGMTVIMKVPCSCRSLCVTELSLLKAICANTDLILQSFIHNGKMKDSQRDKKCNDQTRSHIETG
jgi:hypothetical protein